MRGCCHMRGCVVQRVLSYERVGPTFPHEPHSLANRLGHIDGEG